MSNKTKYAVILLAASAAFFTGLEKYEGNVSHLTLRPLKFWQ